MNYLRFHNHFAFNFFTDNFSAFTDMFGGNTYLIYGRAHYCRSFDSTLICTTMENQTNNSLQSAYHTKTIAGIILMALGVLLFFKGISFLFLISWPMFMIALGLYLGVKNHFRKNNAIVLIAVGVAFLLPNIIPSLSFAMLWPLPLIAIGMFMLLRRNQRWNGANWEKI
jgi:membrane-bound ClpP family serine protease